MRGIDHVHALAFRDLFAGHADFFEDLIGRFTDCGLVHQVATRPKATAKGKALFDDDRPESHRSQVMGADQPGRSGADNDHIALDKLIELLIVFPRDVARDVSFSKGRWFWLCHRELLPVNFCSGLLELF